MLHTKWILTKLCRNLDTLSAAAQARGDTNSSDGPLFTDIAVNLNSARLTIMELLDETGRLDEYNNWTNGMG